MIYFLSIPAFYKESPIKIGLTDSKSALTRLKSCQTGNPWPLQLEATMPGDKNLDKELRERFQDYQCYGGSDWFYPNEELLNLIKEQRLKRRSNRCS
jgi:hypothetical protein